MISVHCAVDAGAARELSALRQEFYRCPTRRTDALFELTDAVLCALEIDTSDRPAPARATGLPTPVKPLGSTT